MIWRLCPVLVAALLAASCGAPIMALPSGAGSASPDAGDVLAQATRTCRAVTTITAEVRVSGRVGERRVRGRLLVGLAAPASAYREAPAPFGSPLFILSAVDGAATLLLPRDRRVVTEGAPADLLEAIAGVALSPADLRRALTGCAEGGNAGAAWRLGDQWRVIPGADTLYLRRQRPTDPWRLVAVVRREMDDRGWRADYGEFVDGLPRSVRMTSLDRRGFDLRLGLSQVEINGELDEAAFRLRIPADARPMGLDELRESSPFAAASLGAHD